MTAKKISSHEIAESPTSEIPEAPSLESNVSKSSLLEEAHSLDDEPLVSQSLGQKLLNSSDDTEESEKEQNPADRFRVDVNDFPIFSEQVSLNERWGDNTPVHWNIDKTLSTFVTNTASLIAEIDGSSINYQENAELTRPDHIIYLDKSARPVSWLVNTFWEDFSDQKRPPHSYLNIDRLPWLRATGVNVDKNGYVKRPNGALERASGVDFDPDKLPPDTFAKIRGLYLPNGVEAEDPELIMNTPSTLDGKNILIVDEVGNSGATLSIAKKLIERAFPEAKDVRGTYFWPSSYKFSPDHKEGHLLSVPVWYDTHYPGGRGISGVDEKYYAERYQNFPNNRTRAQKYGANMIGAPLDLEAEDHMVPYSSRELMREITKMHQEFENGHILMRYAPNLDDEYFVNYIKNVAKLKLSPDKDDPESFVHVANEIDHRPAEL